MIKSIFLSEAIKLSIVINDHCHLKPRLMEYGLRRLFSLEASVKKTSAVFTPLGIARIQISATEVPGSLCGRPRSPLPETQCLPLQGESLTLMTPGKKLALFLEVMKHP